MRVYGVVMNYLVYSVSNLKIGQHVARIRFLKICILSFLKIIYFYISYTY